MGSSLMSLIPLVSAISKNLVSVLTVGTWVALEALADSEAYANSKPRPRGYKTFLCST